ncbi:MAG TPA: alpha/beta fold hydrolase [Solirubrobacteraceae bacterium]|nr:alpha/beta fold hydrolase [Solirubrobacteraceae bacterium]
MSAIERIDVPVAGGLLATFRLGDGAGPVIAVHGITANSREWLAVARALEGQVSLIALDLRGRAASNALPGPFGMDAYTRDLLAVVDHFGLERVVLVGHSLGGYAAARFAADHPERVRAAVLVDGGLSAPLPAGVDPQAVAAAVLGPALERLKKRFPTREAYHDWWRAHPALAHSDVPAEDLIAYADHDLVGEPPELRSSVGEEVVRADAAELLEIGKPADRLKVPAELLCAERGMLDDPNPLQPPALAEPWAAAAPQLRRTIRVAGVNHYTIAMGVAGASEVARAIVRGLQSPASGRGLRSGG